MTDRGVATATALQLTRSHAAGAGASIAVVQGPQSQRDELREAFARSHCILLERFLDHELAGQLARRLDSATFVSEGHSVGENRAVEGRDPAGDLLMFALNDPAVVRSVAELTGADDISCFTGRVYRIEASTGQHLEWHDDRGDPSRRIAMSINLGTEPFQGGTLQVRERESGTVTWEGANTGTGDAVLFRVAEGLEHRVLPVEGEISRTAYAGWFTTGEPLLPLGLSHARRAQSG